MTFGVFLPSISSKNFFEDLFLHGYNNIGIFLHPAFFTQPYVISSFHAIP